jgi:hypothetical protein
MQENTYRRNVAVEGLLEGERGKIQPKAEFS